MTLQNPVFIPGPTNIPEVIRKACDMPTIDHRSELFGEILRPALAGAKRVLKSKDAEVFLFPSTGTGGWEVALSNTLSPGDKVLAARHGMFSDRWIDMAKRLGFDVTVIEVEWGEGMPADRFEEILTADTGHEIRAVLATHNETATGVTASIPAVRKAIDAAKHPALFYVDGVSSIASIDFRMDEWGVDLAVAGSQKGFMLPPGMSIVGFSPRALKAAETAKSPRCYFDIRDMQKAYGISSFPYTPTVGLMNGLKVSCEMLEAEGLDNVFARHNRIASGIRAAVEAWGLTLCAKRPELYSDTVSAIRVPEGFDSARIVSHAAKTYGVAFGAGLGDVAGKVFRIGHLGMLTDVLALSGVATAEMVMADLQLPVELGSGVAAAQDYYRNNPAASKVGAA